MKDYIEERVLSVANYIIDYKATVRQAARRFGISKSTVHKDCTDRLEQIRTGHQRKVSASKRIASETHQVFPKRIRLSPKRV